MQIIYLKPKKHVSIQSFKVRVEDIADVFCQDKILERQVRSLTVKTYDLKEKDTKKILPILEVICAIHQENFKEIEILTIGTQDILLDLNFDIPEKLSEYTHNDAGEKAGKMIRKIISKIISNKSTLKKKNKWAEYCKVIAVVLITFFGSVVAVMTYNEDVQVDGVFQKIIESMGGKMEDMRWMALAYGVGIAVGVIIFFNHFGKKKFDDEPTPMEVEMSKYETELINTRLNAKNQRKNNEHD